MYLVLTTRNDLALEAYAFEVVYLSVIVSVGLTEDLYYSSSDLHDLLLQPMYPTVVILLVETQRSMVDVCDISPLNASELAGPAASEARPATLGHISFARGLVHSTTDNEAESRRPRALQSQGGREHLGKGHS